MLTGILLLTFIPVFLVVALVFGIVGFVLKVAFKVTWFSIKVALAPLVIAAIAVTALMVVF